jgi:hypothetical protein
LVPDARDVDAGMTHGDFDSAANIACRPFRPPSPTEAREPNICRQLQPPTERTKLLADPMRAHPPPEAPEKQRRFQKVDGLAAGVAPLDAVSVSYGSKAKPEVLAPALSPGEVGLDRTAGVRIDRDLPGLVPATMASVDRPHERPRACLFAIRGHIADVEPRTFSGSKPRSSSEQVERQRFGRIL